MTKYQLKDATLIIAAIVLFILLFVGGPDYYSERSYKAAWGTGHIVAFALWTYLLIRYWPKMRTMDFKQQALWLLGIFLIFGIATETIQTLFGRTFALKDLIRDMIGCLLAIAFFLPARKRIVGVKLRSLQLLVVSLVLLEFIPFSLAVTDEIIGRRQFPILADFETPFEVSRINNANIERTDQLARNGTHSLRIQLSTDKYSGVGLSYFPRNWTGYDYLIFSAYNPGKSDLKLTCRVNDFQHIAKSQPYGDRFNRTFDLHKGWNDIRIALKDIFTAPKSRMMDAECIQHFEIFATNLPEPCIIYLDHIYLN